MAGKVPGAVERMLDEAPPKLPKCSSSSRCRRSKSEKKLEGMVQSDEYIQASFQVAMPGATGISAELGAARRLSRGGRNALFQLAAGSRTTVTVQSDSATTWPDTLP